MPEEIHPAAVVGMIKFLFQAKIHVDGFKQIAHRRANIEAGARLVVGFRQVLAREPGTL